MAGCQLAIPLNHNFAPIILPSFMLCEKYFKILLASKPTLLHICTGMLEPFSSRHSLRVQGQ
jgi:hypothetical protein